MPRSTPNRRGHSPSDYGRGHGYGLRNPTLTAVYAKLLPLDEPPDTHTRSGSFVYFLHVPELRRLKIGLSKQPDKRVLIVKSLSGLADFDTELVGVIDGNRTVEWLIHERFKDQRVSGEWFNDVILGDVHELIAQDEAWFS